MLDIKLNIDFSQLKNKNILITGASGLIGLYFLSSLKNIQKEYNIKVCAWIKNDIEPYLKDFFKDFTVIQGDITDAGLLKSLEPFDFIIHAAGYGQPNRFMDDKIKTIKINTLSTMYLLDKLKDEGKFLYISSSEIYSGLDEYHITEKETGKSSTDHPRACYIESKKCGETICYSSGKNIKIARLSLAYGPGAKKGDKRVLYSLIEKAMNNNCIELLDGGESIRTYCYITDVIEMMWNIFLHGKEAVYNVAGISQISILDLAKLIGKEFIKEVITPAKKNELIGSPKIVNISVDRYVQEFNKTEFVDINQGLKNTIDWYKNI